MRRTLSCLKSVPNRQDKFLFDLNGYIHIKNALSTTEIDSMNTAITQHQEKQVIRSDAKLKNAVSGSGMAAEGSRIDMGGMMGWEGEHGAIFRQMLCHPNIAPYLNAFLGKGYRLDHAPLVLVNGPNSEGFHLHGGPVTAEGAFNPELQYREHNGDIWTSLMGVSIALMDSEPDEGGFCVLPGSHKGNFPLPNDFRHGDSDAFHEHIHKPVTKAGDVIFFSEATVHGALPWIPHDAEKERRLALYRFAPPTLSYGRAYLEEWGGNVLENCTEDEKAVLTEPYACRMDRKVPGEVLVERDATKRAHDKKIFGTEYF
mgnify:CR=1 FL=1|jgi:hypothetical protein